MPRPGIGQQNSSGAKQDAGAATLDVKAHVSHEPEIHP
jgi:hypothetical protein